MADPSFTHKWIPRIEQRERNLFVEEYYSSTDVQIKMEGEEQFEIGYIQYSLQEQLKPLYGYASRAFDDMAVGNRIVTGMFTVPIKNPDGQTSLDDILRNQETGASPWEDYNKSQDEMKDAVDWISGGSGGYVNPSSTPDEPNPYDYGGVSDEDLVYSEKLTALGYDYGNETLTSDAVKLQVKKFQEANGMEVTGNLNTETMNKINEKFEASHQEKITIQPGTKLYSGPSTGHEVIMTIKELTQAVIIAKYDEKWIEVMLPDGTVGFMEQG